MPFRCPDPCQPRIVRGSLWVGSRVARTRTQTAQPTFPSTGNAVRRCDAVFEPIADPVGSAPTLVIHRARAAARRSTLRWHLRFALSTTPDAPRVGSGSGWAARAESAASGQALADRARLRQRGRDRSCGRVRAFSRRFERRCYAPLAHRAVHPSLPGSAGDAAPRYGLSARKAPGWSAKTGASCW